MTICDTAHNSRLRLYSSISLRRNGYPKQDAIVPFGGGLALMYGDTCLLESCGLVRFQNISLMLAKQPSDFKHVVGEFEYLVIRISISIYFFRHQMTGVHK